MRARVLKIEGEQVTLGVYHQGEWWRVAARTRVPLQPMSWIRGELIFPGDGSEVYFRIDNTDPEDSGGEEESSGSIDLQA